MIWLFPALGAALFLGLIGLGLSLYREERAQQKQLTEAERDYQRALERENGGDW